MAYIASDIPIDPLYSSRRVCEEFGGVQLITIRRWRKVGRLPEPVVIAGKNYWPKSVIERIKREGDGSHTTLPGEIGPCYAT